MIFEQLEHATAAFAHTAIRRGACPCCVARALVFTAIAIADQHDLADEVAGTLRSVLKVVDEPQEIASH